MFHRPSAAIDKRKITTALAGQQEQRNVAANSMCQHGRHTTGRHAPPAQTRRKSRRRLSEITSDQRPVRKINAKEQRALKREPLAPSSSPYQLGRECWKAGGSQRTRQRRTGWSPLPECWGWGGGGWCPRTGPIARAPGATSIESGSLGTNGDTTGTRCGRPRGQVLWFCGLVYLLWRGRCDL